MVNFIEGGTTLLFSTFDKTQSVWSYRGLNLASIGFNYLILGIVPTKSPFSQKVLRENMNKKYVIF